MGGLGGAPAAALAAPLFHLSLGRQSGCSGPQSPRCAGYTRAGLPHLSPCCPCAFLQVPLCTPCIASHAPKAPDLPQAPFPPVQGICCSNPCCAQGREWSFHQHHPSFPPLSSQEEDHQVCLAV